MLKVLFISPAFFPATYWGGPIHSLYALCNALAAIGEVEVRVLTTDSAGPRGTERLRDIDRSRVPFRYEVVFAKKTLGAEVSVELLRRLFPMVARADVVHLTGAYSFPTIPALVVCRLLGKPVVWSPRGALQRWPGARRLFLKRVWERCCDSLLSQNRATLHVTSNAELQDSQERIRNAKVEVIPNGASIPTAPSVREWRPGGLLRVLYLGRLHPIKGIENLLKAVALLRNLTWTCRICGDGDPEYVRHLRETCEGLGIGRQTTFVGHVDDDKRTAELFSADVCVVPSFSESFGMVVVESLAHGVPVIAGKGTPWQEIERRDCGLWRDNSPEEIRAALESLSNVDLDAMGSRGRQWMMECFGWEAVASKMVSCYRGLCDPR